MEKPNTGSELWTNKGFSQEVVEGLNLSKNSIIRKLYVVIWVYNVSKLLHCKVRLVRNTPKALKFGWKF